MGDKAIEIPEWDAAAVTKDADSVGAKGTRRLSQRVGAQKSFGSLFPAHKQYLGMSRRLLLVLALVLLVLVALIIGLSVGLSKRSRHVQDLPLPSNGQTFTGDLTYYIVGPGEVMGACGEESGQYDDVVAVSHIVFDAAGSSSSTGGNSNNNPLCGKMIRATRYNEAVNAQRSVDLKVVDRCTGCAATDIDTSAGAFSELAPIADGRVNVTWAWL